MFRTSYTSPWYGATLQLPPESVERMNGLILPGKPVADELGDMLARSDGGTGDTI